MDNKPFNLQQKPIHGFLMYVPLFKLWLLVLSLVKFIQLVSVGNIRLVCRCTLHLHLGRGITEHFSLTERMRPSFVGRRRLLLGRHACAAM
jgi:hypothetical protein